MVDLPIDVQVVDDFRFCSRPIRCNESSHQTVAVQGIKRRRVREHLPGWYHLVSHMRGVSRSAGSELRQEQRNVGILRRINPTDRSYQGCAAGIDDGILNIAEVRVARFLMNRDSRGQLLVDVEPEYRGSSN